MRERSLPLCFLLGLLLSACPTVAAQTDKGAAPDGDLDRDGSVDAVDFQAMAGYLSGTRHSLADALARGDMNSDGVLDALDSVLLRRRAEALTRVICVDDDNSTAAADGSPGHPFRTVRDALAVAAGGTTVKVAGGEYVESLTVDCSAKDLRLVGGFSGGSASDYSSGRGGDFTTRSQDPSATTLRSPSVGEASVRLVRFNDRPMSLLLDNFRVTGGRRGVWCDTEIAWPHVENVVISHNIIEGNGSSANPSVGDNGIGIAVAGVNLTVADNVIRDNHGGRGPGIGRVSRPVNLLVRDNLVEDNHSYSDHAGGVYLDGEVTLRGNVIRRNRVEMGYGWGGGILVLGRAFLSGNRVEANHAPSYGGGIFVDEGATAFLDHELIVRNTSDQHGAGIAVDDGSPGPSTIYMSHCTVAQNANASPDERGGNGVYLDNRAFAEIRDCIFWENGDDFYIRPGSTSSFAIAYTLAAEPVPGEGNLQADPLFANPSATDFHLRSTAGRWDPLSGGWVIDAFTSPAIDSADPASAFSNEPFPNGGRADMGHTGNTSYASRSPGR